LQISLAQERRGLPELRRYRRQTGYTEAGPYQAERLVDEAAQYQQASAARCDARTRRSLDRETVACGLHLIAKQIKSKW